ncbi:MAG: AI-2E family transporter [Planctomycetota bacterium]|nr:MAG: AI-2E family transporter [Planctomycetota bacterium]
MNEDSATSLAPPQSDAAGKPPQPPSSRRIERVKATSLAVLATLAVFAVLYVARSVLFPITVALLLNLLLSPLVTFLHRLRIPNSMAAAMVLMAAVLVTVVAIAALFAPAANWISRAPEGIREIERKLRSVRRHIVQIETTSKELEKMTDLDGEKPLEVAVKQPSFSNTVLNTSGGFLAGVFVTLVLLYFLLAAGDHFLGRMVEMMPTWGEKRTVVEMVHRIERGMSTYLLTTAAINAVLGVFIGVAMGLAGLPNPILWGVMAALLNFVPFVGLTVGTVVVFLVGLLSLETTAQAFIPPALYVGINAIEANFITPTLVGRTISLNPVMIMVFLVVWGWMWGVGGAIIAVPLLAVTKIVCDSFEATMPWGRFLGE